MRKGILVGLGAVLALATAGATDASACSRRVVDCRAYGPPAAYPVPPAPVYGYGYGPPPAYYAPPAYGYGYGYGRADYYGPVAAPYYGYRARRNCDRGYYGYGYGNGYGNGYNNGYGNGYGYGSPAYNGYRPAGVWVPVR